MGKQREAFGRARFNQLLKKKGIDTNKMHSDNEKDAAAAKKRKDAAGKDLASFRKKTGINSEFVNEIDEALTMVSRKPHPTGGHIVTLKDKDGKKVVRHLHKGKVKTLSKEETELDEKRNIKIAKSGKGERMVNKQELRTYLQMGWKEVKEGNGLWANIAAKKARGEKMRAKGAKGAPTDAQIKHAQSTSESVEPITELTAKEKQLVNQMYDKKGNLTPLGKKVFNHNKKPGDKGYVE